MRARTWAYLSNDEHHRYLEKAENLGISEGELTQKLIQLYLNTGSNTLQPENCLGCRYYQIATSNVIQFLMKAQEQFLLTRPSYDRDRTGR